MARCGCVEKCSCVFKEGVCAEVEIQVTSDGGCISPTFSYGVNVQTDNQTVFCGPGGLNAVLTSQDTNTVDLSGTGTAASPLEAHVIRTPDANVPDPEALGTGNLIKELPGAGGGIYVSCEDIQDCVGAAIDVNTADCLEYNDATNTIGILICAEPNGIECAPAGSPGCPTGGLLVSPSADVDNSLVFGTDGRLYAAAAAIAPGDCMVFTGAGTQADPFVMSPQIASEPNGIECVPGTGLLVTPSTDAGNRLTFGVDQRLFVNNCPIVNGGDQLLFGNVGPCFEFQGGDCGVPIVATLRISDDVCQGIQCRPDGLYVNVNDADAPPNPQITVNFGAFGPFNGNIPADTVFIVPPTCITITNNSNCRFMLSNGTLSGFADTGRDAGAFRLAFDIDANGDTLPPWFAVSQFGQANPMPASRQTANAIWSGDEIGVPAGGGTRSLCVRVQFNATDPGAPVVNGRVFSGQFTLSLVGRYNT